MNERLLRTFVAVAESGSFARGGAAVGLTPSAVSLQIAGLEDELGAPLFDRNHRPPALTPQGRVALERAREILVLYDRLRTTFRPESRGRRVALGAVPTALTGILPLALRALREREPLLNVSVTSGLSHDLERRVLAGELDAALVTQPPSLPDDLAFDTIDQEPLMAIAPAGTAAANDRELLEALPYIRFRRFAYAAEMIDARLAERGIAVRQVMEIDSLEAIVALVSQGLGVSIVPRRSIASPFPSELVVHPFGAPAAVRVLGILQRRASAAQASVALIATELRAAVGDLGTPKRA